MKTEVENETEKENQTKNDEKIEEIINDRYKDYHTSPFEPMKNANPRVLIGIGIIAIILAVVIIFVFGGPKKADAKMSACAYTSYGAGSGTYKLSDEDDEDDGYEGDEDDDPYRHLYSRRIKSGMY